MSDQNVAGETPIRTPRRTLGISRRTPKSAPLPSRSTVKESASSRNPSHRLTVDNSVLAESHQSSEKESAHATPVISKRKRALDAVSAIADSAQKTKIGKKLNLSLETSPERARVPPPHGESIAEVQADIERIKADIEAHKMHNERKQTLLDSIELWQTNALAALKDLQEKIEPKQSILAILDHLRIPHDMFDISTLEDD